MRHSILVPITIVLASILPGCISGTEGIEGNYTFYDRTPPAEHAFPWDGDQTLAAALAVGARIDVGVSNRGIVFQPRSADVDLTSVAVVDGVRTDGFTLLGKAAGTALVTVHGASMQDGVRIQVREPDGAAILVRPWNWYPLPATFYDQGLAILQGRESHLFGVARSNGTDLTGFGPYVFQAGTTGASVIAATPRARSNFLDLKGVAPGVETFTFGPSDSVQVAVVTEEDITSVVALEAWHSVPGPAFTCKVGETLYVVLVPYDAAGRMVVGATTGDAPTVTIDESSVPFLSDTTPGESSEELKDVLQNRTVFLKCDRSGDAQATIHWRTFEVPITFAIE